MAVWISQPCHSVLAPAFNYVTVFCLDPSTVSQCFAFILLLCHSVLPGSLRRATVLPSAFNCFTVFCFHPSTVSQSSSSAAGLTTGVDYKCLIKDYR